MKKKLFIFVTIAIATICLFALGASAATTNEFADTAEALNGIDLSGMSSDSISKVVLKHTEGENTIYTTYPAQYIVKSSTTLDFDFSKINSSSGITYSTSSIVRLQVPSNITAIGQASSGSVLTGNTTLVEIDFSNTTEPLSLGHNCFKGCTGLTSIYLTDNVYFPDGVYNYQFSGCSNLVSARLPSRANRIPDGFLQSCSKLITIENFPKGVTEIGAYAFESCSALTSTLDLSDVTTVGKRAFRYCSNAQFANINKLEYVDGDAFQGCSKLASVTFGPSLTYIGTYSFSGTAITYIKFNGGSFTIAGNSFGAVKYEGPLDLSGCTSVGTKAFYGSYFTSVNLGNDMLTVEGDAFKGCSKIQTLILGAKLQTVGGYSFADCTSLKKIYVSDTITSFGTGAFNNTGSNRIVYATSGDTDYLSTVKSAFSASSIVALADFVPENYTSGKYVVSGYNKCDAFYGSNHTLTGTNCKEADSCKICTLAIEAQSEHTIVETLTYESLTENGVYTCDCTFNGCTVVDVTAEDEGSLAPAIFVANGFSTKGEDGIAGGYIVDVDAVNEYKRINGSLTIGIMVVNPNYLDGKDSFLDAEGKVNTSGGALQVNMTDNQYTNISVAITGFTGEAQSVSLVIALYAYTDADEVEFIQSQTTKCASENVTLGEQTLYTVTLASVKSANSDLSDLGDYVMPSQKEQE